MNGIIDNIIIGELIEGLTEQSLGITPSENTIRISMEQSHKFDNFIPRILVSVGLFSTTSEIKRIHNQRVNNSKLKDPRSKKIWRTINEPEMTHFKIGKRNFWLIVGQ